MKIVIIGFRGSGKSTFGKLLAHAMMCPFIDTDTVVEKQANMKIPEIFLKEGESGFRKREKEAVCSLHSFKGVIACGGGAILDPDNARLLKQNGRCIWLKAAASTIWKRIQNDRQRPPLTPLSPLEEIQKLLEVRSPIYMQHADQIVSTDQIPIQDLLAQVLKNLEVISL